MKDLVEMLDTKSSDEQVVRKIYEMHSSGELKDILRLIEDAGNNRTSAFELAREISLQYFGCEIGRWYHTDVAFWIKKRNASSFEAVVIYSNIENLYLGYFFEIDTQQLTAEQFASYAAACPPPDDVRGAELRQMYSVMHSLDIASAKDKLATESEEVKNLWLKKYGIISEGE